MSKLSGKPSRTHLSLALAQYFDDLSGTPLLSSTEEAQLAGDFELAEVAHWEAMLSYPPALDRVLGALRGFDAVELPRELGRMATLSHAGKRTAKQRKDYATLAAKVAPKLRELDVDRDLAEAAHMAVVDFVHEHPRQTKRLQQLLSDVTSAQAAHMAIKHRFVSANLRLVISIARRYAQGRMAFEDVIQEGNLGLLKAVERFDPHRGFRFSTYASWWIRHAVTRGIADKARLVRIPVHTLDRFQRVRRASQRFTAREGRAPTSEELAREAETTLSRIANLDGVSTAPASSLNEMVGDESRETFMDALVDEAQASADTSLEAQRQTELLYELLDRLEPMEADILRCRFGLQEREEQTLREIGERYNLSRERIRQIQEESLLKLRHLLREHDKDSAAA